MKKFHRIVSVLLAGLCAGVSLAAAQQCDPVCRGDINGDGSVGITDYLAVLESFGTANPTSDLNGNGIVGQADLHIVEDNWGTCVCRADLNGDEFIDFEDMFILRGAILSGIDCRADLGRNGTVASEHDLDILTHSWGLTNPDADPRADLDGDGDVGIDEFLLLLAADDDCRADLDRDGDVDFHDVGILRCHIEQHVGFQCPSP